jgi:hypothetical protein
MKTNKQIGLLAGLLSRAVQISTVTHRPTRPSPSPISVPTCSGLDEAEKAIEIWSLELHWDSELGIWLFHPRHHPRSTHRRQITKHDFPITCSKSPASPPNSTYLQPISTRSFIVGADVSRVRAPRRNGMSAMNCRPFPSPHPIGRGQGEGLRSLADSNFH